MSRERGASEIIRAAERRSKRAVPAALRTILGRCLADRPSFRYRRALELAEDLNRWRADQPLAYATEPFWTYTLPRWTRRKRRLVAASGILAVLLTTIFFVFQMQSTLQILALNRLTRAWDDIESGVFQFQRTGFPAIPHPKSLDPIATAARALKDYRVLENRDWRDDEEIRNLPAADRDDLELWLVEQCYRYARALSERTGSSEDDRLRALDAIDHVNTVPPLQALEQLRNRLNTQRLAARAVDSLEQPIRAIPSGEPPWTQPNHRSDRTPPWMESYLMGVASELDDESRVIPDAPVSATDPALSRPVGSAESTGDSLQGSPPNQALPPLSYYERVLAQCPSSFWGHYRAAVVCLRLKRWSEAAVHLDRCLQRRPNNAAVRGQFAACLRELGLLEQAFRQCNLAVDAAPDHAEFYQSRAYIRASRGQTDGLSNDLLRFERLSGYLPRYFRGEPEAEAPHNLDNGFVVGRTETARFPGRRGTPSPTTLPPPRRSLRPRPRGTDYTVRTGRGDRARGRALAPESDRGNR